MTNISKEVFDRALTNDLPRLIEDIRRQKVRQKHRRMMIAYHLWTWLFLLLFLGGIVWVLNH